MTTEETKIILKAYFTQKVGSVGNFECGNQVYSRRQMQTYEPWYIPSVYSIKLTQQKGVANYLIF